MIATTTLSVVLAVGSSVGTPVSADSNPFGTLSCNSQDPPSAFDGDQKQVIDRGIRDALSGRLAGPSH